MSGGSNGVAGAGAPTPAAPDMAAFERLPEMLRAQLAAAAVDVDAASVGLALDAERRRHPGSEAMAVCATAAGLERFLARVAAQHERRAG